MSDARTPEVSSRRPSGPPEARGEFVKEMYRVYWSNMARSMEGVWKVLAPITIAGTIVGAVHRDYIPASSGLALAILIVFWGINVTIDLNAWHRRNLFFATKAELEFLSAADYGRLLPSGYQRPKDGWITFYKINVVSFVVMLVVVVVYGITRLNSQGRVLPTCTLVVGVIGTILNARAQEASARKHYQQLFPGTPPTT